MEKMKTVFTVLTWYKTSPQRRISIRKSKHGKTLYKRKLKIWSGLKTHTYKYVCVCDGSTVL